MVKIELFIQRLQKLVQRIDLLDFSYIITLENIKIYQKSKKYILNRLLFPSSKCGFDSRHPLVV